MRAEQTYGAKEAKRDIKKLYDSYTDCAITGSKSDWRSIGLAGECYNRVWRFLSQDTEQDRPERNERDQVPPTGEPSRD